MLELSDDMPKAGVLFVKYQQHKKAYLGDCFGVVITADHSEDRSLITKLVKAAKEGELMVVDVVSEKAKHRESHMQKYCDLEIIVPADCKLDAEQVAKRYFDSFNDIGLVAIDVEDICNQIRTGSGTAYAFYGCGNTAAMAVQALTQSSSFAAKLASAKSVLIDVESSEPRMSDLEDIINAIEKLASNDCAILFTLRLGVETDGVSVMAIIR